MPRKPRTTAEIMQDRLSLIGRAMLEASGFNDTDIRRAHEARRRALDATRVKVLQHKGELLYSEPQVDHDVQLRAAQDVFEMADYYPAKLGVDVAFELKATSDAELLAILASLGPDPRLALGEGGA